MGVFGETFITHSALYLSEHFHDSWGLVQHEKVASWFQKYNKEFQDMQDSAKHRALWDRTAQGTCLFLFSNSLFCLQHVQLFPACPAKNKEFVLASSNDFFHLSSISILPISSFPHMNGLCPHHSTKAFLLPNPVVRDFLKVPCLYAALVVIGNTYFLGIML